MAGRPDKGMRGGRPAASTRDMRLEEPPTTAQGETMSDSESPEFSTLLLQHAKGRAHDEATRKLAQLVTAVKETGKGGSITVQIKVVPDKKIDGVVKIEDKVTASIPFDQSTSMWFTDDKGQLHRNDPKQAPLWESEPSNSNAGK